MTPTIILAAIVLVPVVLFILLRINAALVFLSLCLGNVLVQFVAPDAHSFMALFATHSQKALSTSDDTIKLILLLLPVILTALFMVKTVKKGPKLLLNVLPAAGVGLLLALLVVPLLPYSINGTILSGSLWTQIQKAQDLIVSASAIVCLLTIWSQRPKVHDDEKHGKKHKG